MPLSYIGIYGTIFTMIEFKCWFPDLSPWSPNGKHWQLRYEESKNSAWELAYPLLVTYILLRISNYGRSIVSGLFCTSVDSRIASFGPLATMQKVQSFAVQQVIVAVTYLFFNFVNLIFWCQILSSYKLCYMIYQIAN